ncbi:MAG: hypothetical protein R2711_05790 [Acidimicrobiales bacterium]
MQSIDTTLDLCGTGLYRLRSENRITYGGSNQYPAVPQQLDVAVTPMDEMDEMDEEQTMDQHRLRTEGRGRFRPHGRLPSPASP